MTGTGAGNGNLDTEGDPDAAVVEDEPDARPVPDAAPVVEPDATPACTNASAYTYSDYHNDPNWGLGGDGCMGSCHDGEHGFKLTIGGRVYNRRTIPQAQFVAGAHVYIIDADGQVLDLITDAEGKFYYDGEVAFPVKTYASGCPDSIPMVAPAATGNCNEGSGGVCHDNTNRIYLPNPLDPPAPL